MDYIKKFLIENEINLLASCLFPIIFLLILNFNSHDWNNAKQSLNFLNTFQQLFSVLWLAPLPIAIISFFGLLLYKTGSHLESQPIPNIHQSKIYFRLATRGNNPKTV